MKKLLLVLLLSVTTFSFSQKKQVALTSSTQTDSTKTVPSTKLIKYVSVGLSFSNGNTYDTNENMYSFKESSYPSIELGVTRENVSVGAVFGRGNFNYIGAKTDIIKNYYWELKVSPSFPLGILNANLIFGGGSYFNATKAFFIEYGSGVSYTKGNYSYCINYSNWDGIDYITPAITYSFN